MPTKQETTTTLLVPITLKEGVSEADLLAASQRFQTDFVDQQAGVLRRELLRKGERQYIDIVQFRSPEDVEDVVAKEQTSVICQEFFALMESTDESKIESYPSLATYS